MPVTPDSRARLGWGCHAGPGARLTSLCNFPIQANGAEMLRPACCLAAEAGIQVCAPVHDALVIEAGASEIEDAADATRTAVAQESAVLLGALEAGTDAVTVRWPDRYGDPRGAATLATVMKLLQVRAS